MQKMSSKATKNSKMKSNRKESLNESKAKANANYLSNRSKKCSTSTTSPASSANASVCSTLSTAINNNNNKNNTKHRKSIKTVKSVKVRKESKAVKSSIGSVGSIGRKMQKSSTSSATTPLSPLRNKSKTQMSSTATQANEDDMDEMPVLTPEVPFGSDIDSHLVASSVKTPHSDVNYVDLVPPVLSPALDAESKANKSVKSCDKTKNKRKSKVQTLKDEQELDDSLYQFSDNNSDNVSFALNTSLPKKLKQNSKTSEKKSKVSEVNKIKKMNKNFFNNKNSLQKSMEENRKKMFKIFNFNKKSQNLSNESNDQSMWSVDSKHTMSSMSGSMSASKQTAQPFMKYRRKLNELSANGMDCAQNDSLLVHNSSIFATKPLKAKPKLFKKCKSGLNSQSMRTQSLNKMAKKSLFNELIGVQKPEADVDEIEGIVFQSFETEESINLFSKFEQLEREQREQSSISKTFKIKSLKSGKVIFPTKTKDITKIKGWREKLFSSIDQKQSAKRAIGLCKPLDHSFNQNKAKTYSSFISDASTARTSQSGSKSAFFSDILDGYLRTKSDLNLKYLNPDFAAPPDDSPIFSASVLKMPDFCVDSMPPPPTPSSSQSTPNKRKGIFGRSKGLKNKLNLKTEFSSDSILDEDEEAFSSELLLPQYPVIRETLWPDTALSDEYLLRLYNEYMSQSYREQQVLKRPNAPSFIMDDHYARYALSALQCNEQRIPFVADINDNADNVLMAVGLAPKPKDIPSVSETKITGRYRKDREADLAKIIAMGNRSKRQIRLPSRFHESSLLMGNQWVIPDYDQKGKTGKRRLQQEQKRLQELHQRQLELEQRNQPAPTNETMNFGDDSQLSLIHKKLSNSSKALKAMKTKQKSQNCATVPSEYQLKIPHQRLKQMQLIRDRKNQMKSTKGRQQTDPQTDDSALKHFTSLYSLSTRTVGDKRMLSLSAKAAASATQRAVVNQLFLYLSETVNQDKPSLVSKNGKLNKLETMKEAIETIEKLSKRQQQLAYIKKLLSMWNHKLQLCSKVAQKDMKPEAYKVVTEVMNTYKNSMCYKVGEALEAKRKEFQQKRAQLLASQSASLLKSPKSVANGSQVITIPSSNTSVNFKTPFKPPKAVNQRLILPKLSPLLNKNVKTKTETIVSPNGSNSYPKLMTPDLHQKNVNELTADPELVTKEGSLLKPPILTTRPTVLKPFLSSTEGIPKPCIPRPKSVTGPIINVPNISRIKSMTKSMQMCSSGSTSLITSSTRPHLMTPTINSSPISASTRLKLPLNSFSGTNMSVTSLSNSPMASSSQYKSAGHYSSPHSYAGKSVIITSETPLANEDLTKIVASITANPDNFKKVPVRLSNGMAALSIPPPIDMTTASKASNYTSSTATAAPTLSVNFTTIRPKDDSKSQKIMKTLLSQSPISSPTLAMNVSKPNILQKQNSMTNKAMDAQTDGTECIEID